MGCSLRFPTAPTFAHLTTSVHGNTQEQSHNAMTRTIVILLTSGLLSANLADTSPLVSGMWKYYLLSVSSFVATSFSACPFFPDDEAIWMRYSQSAMHFTLGFAIAVITTIGQRLHAGNRGSAMC